MLPLYLSILRKYVVKFITTAEKQYFCMWYTQRQLYWDSSVGTYRLVRQTDGKAPIHAHV